MISPAFLGNLCSDRLERRDEEAREDGGRRASKEHQRHTIRNHRGRAGQREEVALPELVAGVDRRAVPCITSPGKSMPRMR